MPTEAQREASRLNGAKSRGPKSPEGKERVKFNGLRHGLRAEQVVLPGEDPAEFEAERRAWVDDWNPPSHTRAVLVERAAIASWRLGRAVRADAAERRRHADEVARDFDLDQVGRVDRAIARFEDDPGAALTLLESHAAGLDRLLKSWGELADALEAGPSGWDRPLHHTRLMLLLGRLGEDDPALAGQMGRASARLLAANEPGGAPMPATEAEAAVEGLRRLVAESVARLRAKRERAADPAAERRLMVDARLADDSPEAQLRFRYEMAIERSLRSTIKQLVDLDRSGADLAGPAEAEPEPRPVEAPPALSAPDPAPEPSAPGSLGAGDPGSDPARSDAPPRAPRPPARAPAGAVVGGLTP